MKNTDLPVTADGVEAFLISRYVEGIGKIYAQRLVAKYGVEAVTLLRDHPDDITDIPGLTPSRIETASESIRSLCYPLEFLLFLYSCGIGEMFVERILSKYRAKAEKIVLSDPYSMVEDVWRLSFFTADKIGRCLDIENNDPRRLRGALLTAVKAFAEEGHLFVQSDRAIEYAAGIADATFDKVKTVLPELIDNGRLVESDDALYLPVYYEAEVQGAERLAMLASAPLTPMILSDIPTTGVSGQIYSTEQRKAIELAITHPVVILTGGPGSGKTTVLKGIFDMLCHNSKKVVMVAPTGRAAKRMSQLTGMEASTIHRLLGYRQGEGYRRKTIDTDVLIIDEGSMLEQVLFNHLLQGIKDGTKLIIVGDVDQLPAIGAGNVLRDMIDSGVIPVASLDNNYRQDEGSNIAIGAREINAGMVPKVNTESDLLIVDAHGVNDIRERILSLVSTELPERFGINSDSIRVVTPQQMGPLGARQLNIDLQERLNPSGPAVKRGSTILRLGDPVMQTANSSERHVYNGETGCIVAVNTDERSIEVEFDDSRRLTYTGTELSELIPAYATTVHKLQGSEVKYMVMPVTMAHKPMLYRNLLYTGVSRARRLCVLVGEEEAIRYSVRNTGTIRRNSAFGKRLREAMLRLAK